MKVTGLTSPLLLFECFDETVAPSETNEAIDEAQKVVRKIVEPWGVTQPWISSYTGV